MEGCCCSSSCCGEGAVKCPACGAVGRPVPFETVKSMVSAALPDAETFGVCLSAGCDVVYFNAGRVFRQADVRITVGWKAGMNPKYICYCNQVTEEEIVRAVTERGAGTVADVAKATGAMKNGNCVINNPQGVCCHADIESTIRRALESR